MSQSGENRTGNGSTVRIAGVGVGLLGATLAVSGWFTLATTAAATESAAVAVGTFTSTSSAPASVVSIERGVVHTRTGGA